MKFPKITLLALLLLAPINADYVRGGDLEERRQLAEKAANTGRCGKYDPLDCQANIAAYENCCQLFNIPDSQRPAMVESMFNTCEASVRSDRSENCIAADVALDKMAQQGIVPGGENRHLKGTRRLQRPPEGITCVAAEECSPDDCLVGKPPFLVPYIICSYEARAY